MGVPRAVLRLAVIILSIAGALAPGAQAAQPDAPQVIYYNQGGKANAEKRFNYKVLQLIVSKCGKPYQLRPTPMGRMTDSRAAEALAAGEPVDVAWLAVSAKLDQTLTPVSVPIDRGLLGYRLFLIDQARQDEFSHVRNLADLRRLKALQGAGWQDTTILRQAGLPVRTGDYDHLFRMTLARRGDYFPRSAFEAYSEQADHVGQAPGITVERSLVLHYPLTSMFYVRRANHTLHDDLYRGFMRAYADGSYMRLFHSDPGIRAAIYKAKLSSRRVIEIDNPFLSPQTRGLDARFWYHP